MRIYFKPKVTLICVVLAACMLRLALWQWHRHLEKQELIHRMETRLAMPPKDLNDLIVPSAVKDWDAMIHRRVRVAGNFDFEHEMVLRNRRLGNAAGSHVLTPLHLDGSGAWIIVDRGFIPFSQSSQDKRKQFRNAEHAAFVGLVKPTNSPFWIAPQDPPAGPGLPWVDAWLRVDLTKMGKQLPYPVLPIYLELMGDVDPASAENEIVRSSSGREELLFLGLRGNEDPASPDYDPSLHYPVPAFDTVIPPARHLGYVYEWSTMAIMTLLIGFVLQLRPSGASMRKQAAARADSATPGPVSDT